MRLCNVHAPGQFALRDASRLPRRGNAGTHCDIDRCPLDAFIAGRYILLMSDENISPNAIAGDKVRRFREAAGISQAELARRMDVAQPHLWQLERGLRTWSIQHLTAAADGIGVDAALLLGGPQRRTPERAAS